MHDVGRPEEGGWRRGPRSARAGGVQLEVEGEPDIVVACHCDFCQKRSGNVFIAAAHYAATQVTATGETSCYNGLEVDGVGAARS